MNKIIKNKIILFLLVAIVLVVVYSIPFIFCSLGKSYLEKEQYVNAYKILHKAYVLKPNEKSIRYYYVKSMTYLKPTEKIQVEVFKFSQDKKADAAQVLAEQQVMKWKDNILTNIGENYIEQAPYDSELLRWDINSFPLKVFLKIPISTPDYYREEIEKAFIEWSIRTNFLKFKFVDTEDADIIVKFDPLPEDICEDGVCKYVVGYTIPKINGKRLKNMTIIMYDKDANGNYFSDKELYNTILHEIGHALGIMGHSYSSDNLMYISNNPDTQYTRYRGNFRYLSNEDLNTITLLYKLIPNITNVPISKLNKEGLIYAPIVLGNEKQITNRKIEEAKSYIENAPDLPNGYIDLGIAYAELENYSKALDEFRNALDRAQTDNDRYLIYYNIAVIHLNSNHIEEAEKYLELAKTLNNNDDLTELETNLNHAKATRKKPFKTGF